MNKDFILLNNGNIVVSDENNNKNVREYTNGSVRELLSENKKELIDKKIDETKKSLSEDRKVKGLSKWMLIIQPFILVFMVILGFFIGGFTNINNFIYGAIYNSVYALFGAGACVLISTLYWSIFSIIYKNKIKKKEIKLETMKNIQKEYEKEKNLIKEYEYNKCNVVPNKAFSLMDDTKRIERNLDDMIDSSLSSTLSLKKRK